MNQEALGIGRLITTPQSRDAIHVAVCPLYAGESLKPGQWIGLDDKGDAVLARVGIKAIGIVDPFLTEHVNGPLVSEMKGERFWAFLIPGSITSLRHDWTHPAFDAPPALREHLAKKSLLDQEREEAQEWLRVMGGEYGFDPEELVRDLEAGKGYCFGGSSYGELVNRDDFWEKVEAALGHPISAVARNTSANSFSCSC